MIEGQMGIKQDGQGRYIAAPSVSGGSGKDSPLQTSYSYSPSVLLADGPAKEKWSQQVMAASLVSSTLPKSERSLISSQDSGKLLETKIEASYIDDKAALALFKDVNQDMYIHPGKGKPFLADANDMKYTPVGISADLASQDIEELAINSSNNRKFENISGVMVVERDVKDEYGNVTKEQFFRLRGNVKLESTETARQVAFKGGNLAKDDASISASQNRRLYTTEFSNPLNDTDTMQVIKAISKVNPSFKARYETALVVAARNGVDEYDPVSKRKIHADFLKSLVTSPVAK
jgi:hypothetical protein